MRNSNLTPNRIVKVVSGKARGNAEGTIVKILSRPGRLTDQAASISTTLFSDRIMDKVLCESRTGPQTNTLNNQIVCYEYLDDLQLATEFEKAQRKMGNTPGKITIIN